MLLMAGRAGAVLHDVWFVEGVMRVTGLTFLVDQIEGDAVLKTLLHDRAELFRCERAAGHQRFVMTGGAVIAELGVFGGKFSGIKKSFTTARLKYPNRDQPAQD